MQIQKIIGADDKVLGVFIPLSYWEKIQKYLPTKKAVAKESENASDLETALSQFSFFQLNESANSVLADLSAYYSRLIMQENKNPSPNKAMIDKWRKEADALNALKRDHKTFETEESMKNIIRTYSPLLKKSLQ